MPPRIPLFQCLKAPAASGPSSANRAFTTSSSFNASTVTQRKRHRDPYAIAQAKARKAANLSRQEVLKQERAATIGDPIRGVTTPYVKSFDTALPLEPEPPSTETHLRTKTSPAPDAPGPSTKRDEHLNFFLTKEELERGLEQSQWLATPVEEAGESQALEYTSSLKPEERANLHKEGQETASEALRRIASLSLGSSKDRLRANTQRCIDDFGRHNTDDTLPPRPQAVQPATSQPEAMPRSGPDTGSSEVQIAILTAKIRTLADFLQTRGHMDKMNKKNLRLLVHRRQKLLKYLRRKERGGPRWTNLIESLGLTEGTWKGEITL